MSSFCPRPASLNAQADTLTYTVTVNDETVTVTGTTEFVTTFTFPETTLALSFPSMVSG